MNKIIVDVPSDIKYISDWVDYEIPLGKCIIDKGVTGCGYTEFCLTNNKNVILCSPRKLLLKNKVEQHLQDDNILYLENTLEKFVSYDISEKDKLSREETFLLSSQNYTEIQEQFKEKIKNHIYHCSLINKPVKFLVTYDSFKYIYQFLGQERLRDFRIVVDEFQSIFMDSTFKADTELVFSQYIDTCPNVCYLSATPMLDRYLDRLPEFKDLDMYVFKWNNYIEKAMVDRRQVSSAYQCLKGVIQDFQAGKYPQMVMPDKTVKISREAVIYMNSVTDIIRMVNSCSLTPQDTDIICADTDKNQKKLKKIGFTISKPNIYENRHLNKMFTFCTRTVYLGSDFYSDNATTWIASNPNKENLAIDIALDLPQILGRQRLLENPWKNHCTLFYQLTKELRTKESIDRIIDRKLVATENLLLTYNEVPENRHEDLALTFKKAADYKDSYVGISSKTNSPVFNNLVWVSETRFWEVTQQDYIDSINVRRALEDQNFGGQYLQTSDDEEIKALSEYIKSGSGLFEDKMRAYCEYCDSHPQNLINVLDYKIGSKRFSNYYTYFGTEKIRAHSFHESLMKEILENQFKIEQSGFLDELYKTFLVGERYLYCDIKPKLQKLYQKYNISTAPKAKDITKYFETKKTRYNLNKKVVEGFIIISKK